MATIIFAETVAVFRANKKQIKFHFGCTSAQNVSFFLNKFK